MSLLPFRQIFDDSVGQDWLTHDPFRDSFFGGLKNNFGVKLAKQCSPLLTTDLIEKENEFQMLADLPGVDPKDLEVTVQDNNLFITAERKHCHDTSNDKVIRLERSYGKVQRNIRLPKNANLEATNITFKNGVLCICIPKGEVPEPKKLNIES